MSYSCECLQITFDTGTGEQTINAQQTGTFNGFNTFEFVADGVTYYIWHDATTNWYVSETIGSQPYICELKSNTNPCPVASIPTWITTTFETFTTDFGTCNCPCLNVVWQGADPDIFPTPLELELTTPTGFWNGSPFWEWQYAKRCYTLYLFVDPDTNRCQWRVNQIFCGNDPNTGTIIFEGEWNDQNCGCPSDTPFIPIDPERWLFFNVSNCGECNYFEDRHQRKYDAIKLPEIFEEQNRGWKGCCTCEPMPTLASPDPETWKNDVTSAWIKLSDPTDIVTFELTKNGQPTTYIPTNNAFVNEPDAYYTTIKWIDVLNSDGVGCYELKVKYNISGVISEFVWGAYNLKLYTIENALKTARIRVKFNLQHQIEGINFTGSNVEDTIRFYGFIGERQPNMEIDNLIYQDRTMKTVVRENLNTYKITTDPCNECLTTKLTDLYLLSENEMFVSDHNAHNHSYRYLDLPVVVQESPEINYLDILQRKAILTCEIGDRSKNKRTFY